jgi:group I intron endonuclease
MRLHNKIQVLGFLNHHLNIYPTPMNLNYNWSWGSLSGLILSSQIVTGILLAMHYVGHVDHAFASVQHLMVDVPSGMIIRYTHANGASLFFTVVYLHVLRGLYYSSGNQPREILWISGVVILLLMIVTAFIGYIRSQKWILNSGLFLTQMCSFVSKKKCKQNEFMIVLRFLCVYIIVCIKIKYLSLMMGIENLVIKENKSKINILKNFSFEKCYNNLHLRETQLLILKDNKNKSGIYCIYNNINHKFYIGSAITNRINVRFRCHCINNSGGSVFLNKSIQKYGLNNFSFLIIEYFPGFVFKENLRKSHLELLSRETFFIKILKPEYNILKIGGSSLGYKHSDEVRLKTSINYSEERKRKIGELNKGKNLSENTISLISEKCKLNKMNVEYKRLHLEKVKDTLFKGKKVELLNLNFNFIKEYSSVTEMSQIFKCDRKTIRKYLNSPSKLFRKKFFLRYKNLS